MLHFRKSLTGGTFFTTATCVGMTFLGTSMAPAQNPSAVEDVNSNDPTIFVPDPRPGGMSPPLRSGQQTANSPQRGTPEALRSADLGLWFDRSTANGLIVSDVGTGVISRLGFREGDQVRSVNGVRVDSEAGFVQALLDPRFRDRRMNVIVQRHGQPWTVSVPPAELIQEFTTLATDPLETWGLMLDDRYDDLVVIQRVRPRSPAFYAGLRAGDVIRNWQGRPFSGRDEFVQLAGQQQLDGVGLEIDRNRQTRQIDLDLSSIRGATGTESLPEPNLDAGTIVSGATASRASPTRRPAGGAEAIANPRSGIGVRKGNPALSETRMRSGNSRSAAVSGLAPDRSDLQRSSNGFDTTIDDRTGAPINGRQDRSQNSGLFRGNAPSGIGTRGTASQPSRPGIGVTPGLGRNATGETPMGGRETPQLPGGSPRNAGTPLGTGGGAIGGARP